MMTEEQAREQELHDVVKMAMDKVDWPLVFGVMLMTRRNCTYINGDQDVTLEQVKQRVQDTVMLTYRSLYNCLVAKPDSLAWGETDDRNFRVSVALTEELRIDNIQIHYLLTSGQGLGHTI